MGADDKPDGACLLHFLRLKSASWFLPALPSSLLPLLLGVIYREGS